MTSALDFYVIPPGRSDWSGGGAETDGAEILEAHVRLHITHPNRGPDSP